MVNGKNVNIPNIVLRLNDEVSVVSKSRSFAPVVRAMADVKKREIPDWLGYVAAEFKGKVKYLPERHQITVPIEENLVVELYSR
jgi:small subunit ribosomal protein S4